jgi:hypothetical protein
MRITAGGLVVMKRWTLLLFLLLLPFTMAPRTSFNPPVDPLHFDINHPRATPTAGTAVPYVITTTNVSETQWDGVGVGLAWNLSEDGEVAVVSAPRSCEITARGPGYLVCPLGPMAPGDSRSLTLVLRPLAAGDLTLDVVGLTELGSEKTPTEGGSVRTTVEAKPGKPKVK